jgi:hypothetical protein
MPVETTHAANVSILELAIPGGDPVAAGVLLQDLSEDRLYFRLRRDWEDIAPEEADVLSLLDTDLSGKAAEMGAASLLGYLEGTLSNLLRIGDRRAVMVDDFSRALGRLYREHVQSTIREFVTHLPRYSLAVAAGKFLENQEVTEEGWDGGGIKARETGVGGGAGPRLKRSSFGKAVSERKSAECRRLLGSVANPSGAFEPAV